MMLATTLALGIWQTQRLQWKEGVLAAIDRAEQLAPVPYRDGLPPFTRVVIEGEFLPGVARYGSDVRSRPTGAVMGARLISPLQPRDGSPVLVDRGWAPLDHDPAPPPGPVRVLGYLRPPEHAGWFSVSNDLVQRRFFTLDPAAIAASLGLAAVGPDTLVALGSANGFPEPATTLPRPPNNHLVYAITWFSLAACLMGVFAAWLSQSFRERRA